MDTATAPVTDLKAYENAPEGSFFEQAERTFNTPDRLFVVAIFSGIARVFLAIAQFFYAIYNASRESGDGENHFKHAGLNLIRGITAIIPIVGSLTLATIDKQQVRWAYEGEITHANTYRRGCKNNNKARWLKARLELTQIETSSSGFGIIAGPGGAMGKVAEAGLKAVHIA